MATAPVKSQPLHNFSLPFLKWGGKSHTNTTSRHRRTVSPASSEPDSDYHDSDPPPPRVGFRSARNRFGFSPCSVSDRPQNPERGESGAEAGDGGERKREAAEEEEAEAQKPWNLRPRKAVQRSAMMEIGAESAVGAMIEIAGVQQQQQQSENAQPKSQRLRGMTAEPQSTEKRKFWIALSKEEIEEDIFVMTGSRPARRPRKRPKNVQKQLENVFPGLWLVGTTADSFRVVEAPAKRLPYIVGGQSIKRVVILQNHYSIQDLLLDALLASLVLEEYSPFNWASSSGIPDEMSASCC